MMRHFFKLAMGLAMFSPLVSYAAEQEKRSVDLFNGAYLLQVFGSLLLVFGLLFGLIFLLKKLNGGGFQQNLPVKVLSTTRVGAREKILLLDAAGQQLLIGVTPGGVRTLHTYEQPVDSVMESPAAVATDDFQSLLKNSSEEQAS